MKKRKLLFSFQYDHTPVLKIFDDGVDLSGTKDGGFASHERFLEGYLQEEIKNHFGEDVLYSALNTIKKYNEDPYQFDSL